MFFNNIKFTYKIYFIISLLIITFSISMFISHLSIRYISNNIESSKKENENLQHIILLFSDIEKLKRYISEYNLSGDSLSKNEISNIFKNINEKSKDFKTNDEKINRNYAKLIQNIDKYSKNFEVAKEQVPLNLAHKNKLRFDAQVIENLIERLELDQNNIEVKTNFILFRKYLLEVEKGVVRYIETDDRTYVNSVFNKLNEAKSVFPKIEKKSKHSNIKLLEINSLLEKFVLTTKKTIEYYRTYSMLTKVVMAGDILEINHYSQKLKELTLAKIVVINKELDENIKQNQFINKITGVFYLLLLGFGFLILLKTIIKPLKELTKMFEELSRGDENINIPSYNHNDEIGKLIKAADKFKIVNRQTKELLEETKDYKNNLEIKVKEEIKARREREKVLIQQSKLAAMGEMIGAIAHQWRQPLNELTIRIQKLKYNFAKDEINEEFIKNFIEKNKKTIDFMSHTIDDFRNFFRIDKQKILFGVRAAIEEILNIQNAQLKNHNIEVFIKGDEFQYKGFKSEFQQVVMNIISNSKDAFVTKKIPNPQINIEINNNKIFIEDNAGGIAEEILDRVFEPYFTTKQQGEGTGMGLYMSKMIIEDNMKGKISIKNRNKGTLVSINLKGENND